MPEFKEVAVELRGITHTYESDFTVESLLKKRKFTLAHETTQPEINVNHLNHLHSHLNSNGSVNTHLNGGVHMNGSANGHLNHLNNNNNNNNYTSNNNNYKTDDVQMIQSKNFPSFYFRQPENNSEDHNRSFKPNRTVSQNSFAKKLVCDPLYTKRNVLSNLDMTIPKSAIYGLLGPSGCGKTTLLKMICGVIKPDKGTVKVFKCDPQSGLGNIPGHDVGYMPQDYSLHDDLTIELVKLLDLPGDDQVISSLSGGQKRRCSFCCAVIHMPKLLILDEPTVGCDPMLRERIWRLLVNFSVNNKITVIITTHYIEEAKRSSLVGFIKKGCLMAENTPENLFKNHVTTSFVLRDCNQFIFKDTIYKQIHGVPMGLPLSPVLADIVMEHVLDEAMSKSNLRFDVCLKYVDDLFLILPRRAIDYILAVFNSVNKDIQFTHVVEDNNELAFLDTTVIRNACGTIEFNWYSKPTSSSRLLNYRSQHPMNQKLNVIDNLIKRIYTLSSSRFHHQCTNRIKNILKLNDYPMQLINKRIRKFLSSRNRRQVPAPSGTSNSSTDQNETKYRGLMYHGSCSLNIGKILCKNNPNLKLGYKPHSTNRSIFSNAKQKTKEEDLYNVVYNIPCLGDGIHAQCDMNYVGSTGHKVKIRGGQHVDDIIKFNRDNNLEGTTAVVQHYYEAAHFPDTDKMSVLAIEHNKTKRRVLESLHIMTNNTMNFRRDTENISAAYMSLLN